MFRNEDGYSERAIIVIDKSCVIRYVDIHDIDLQPDNDELFRVLEGLEPAAQPGDTQARGGCAGGGRGAGCRCCDVLHPLVSGMPAGAGIFSRKWDSIC